MTTWIIKSETDDPNRALANVEDQRSKGYTAWIEDEHGKAVDEELLRMDKAVPTKTSAREKLQGLLVFFAAAVAALGILYLAGGFITSIED